MALDDKVFQSAIAKINRIKSRQISTVPQVQVFKDPPHLKKPTNDYPPIDTIPLNKNIEENDITEQERVAKEDIQFADTDIDTLQNNAGDTNDLNHKKRVQEYGTNQGTNKGYRKGYK